MPLIGLPNVGLKPEFVFAGGVVFANAVMDWSADGKSLRYDQGDKIYTVEVRNNGGKLEFSAPRPS